LKIRASLCPFVALPALGTDELGDAAHAYEEFRQACDKLHGVLEDRSRMPSDEHFLRSLVIMLPTLLLQRCSVALSMAARAIGLAIERLARCIMLVIN
jgi:hypothetical protein